MATGLEQYLATLPDATVQARRQGGAPQVVGTQLRQALQLPLVVAASAVQPGIDATRQAGTGIGSFFRGVAGMEGTTSPVVPSAPVAPFRTAGGASGTWGPADQIAAPVAAPVAAPAAMPTVITKMPELADVVPGTGYIQRGNGAIHRIGTPTAAPAPAERRAPSPVESIAAQVARAYPGLGPVHASRIAAGMLESTQRTEESRATANTQATSRRDVAGIEAAERRYTTNVGAETARGAAGYDSMLVPGGNLPNPEGAIYPSMPGPASLYNTRTGAVVTPGARATKTPTPGHITAIKADPSATAILNFEAEYGKGSAARYLQK